MLSRPYSDDYPGDSEFAGFVRVEAVNFQPHPFVLSEAHSAAAFESGMTDTIVRAHACSFCGLGYEAHTYERIGFIRLTRNATNSEMIAWLQTLTEWFTRYQIDGFALQLEPTEFEIKADK